MEQANSQVTVLMQTNSDSYKTSALNLLDTIEDMVLFIISDAGTLLRGKHISLTRTIADYDAILNGNNVLRKRGEFYIWSGQSYGYLTDYSTGKFETASAFKYNTFTFRYSFDTTSSMKCLREADMASSTYSSRLERVSITDALFSYESSVKVDSDG